MTGFESKSRQSLCKRAFTSASSRSRSISRYLPIRTFLTSRIPSCCIASRTAAPCGSSTAAFGITTTLAFIISIYEPNGGAPMFFARKKVLLKLFSSRYLSPRNGPSTNQASAAAAGAKGDGVLRQGLPDPRRHRGCSWHRSDRRWFVCRKPRHQHVYHNRAGSNPDAAYNARGTTAGESKIGLASQCD